MSDRTGFPGRPYRIALWVIVILMVIPFLSPIIASSLAEAHGCRLHEGFPTPCIILGMDWGDTLYAMGVLGWLMLASLPFGVVAIALWFVIREIHKRIWHSRHGTA